MTVTGNMMEIERFAIHDGPGIRSTVFIQGCPLHCPWCANPESQVIHKHLMYNEKKCLKCGTCVRNCPQKAISIVGDHLEFDRTKCVGCETCKKNCPGEAIYFIGTKTTTDEVFDYIKQDMDYYTESGGGITVSGGEPFVQFDFFLDLIKKCKAEGIGTAVETTGNTQWEKMAEAEPYIDTFLFDMKHADPEMIIKVTGGDGYLIQENMRKLAKEHGDKIVMRVPVIPGFNYDDKTLKALIDMAKELNLREVNLLPYHNLGANKYAQLGKEYPMGNDLKMMNKKELADYAAYGEKVGVKVQLGG